MDGVKEVFRNFFKILASKSALIQEVILSLKVASYSMPDTSTIRKHDMLARKVLGNQSHFRKKA